MGPVDGLGLLGSPARATSKEVGGLGGQVVGGHTWEAGKGRLGGGLAAEALSGPWSAREATDGALPVAAVARHAGVVGTGDHTVTVMVS